VEQQQISFISNTTTCGVMDSMLTLSVVFISNTTTCGVMDSMLTLSVVVVFEMNTTLKVSMLSITPQVVVFEMNTTLKVSMLSITPQVETHSIKELEQRLVGFGIRKMCLTATTSLTVQCFFSELASNHFEFINKIFEMKLKLLQGEYGPSPS
jgi:hypothetical protein